MLHVQLISDDADDMVKEALKYRSILKEDVNLHIKIPVTPDGYKAMRLLKEQQFHVTATAIFTQQQALVAAQAGADFVAAYVNRLEQYNSQGIQLIADIAKSLKVFNLETKILAASFKTVEQVQQASLAGSHAATLNYDLLKMIIEHPLTEHSETISRRRPIGIRWFRQNKIRRNGWVFRSGNR